MNTIRMRKGAATVLGAAALQFAGSVSAATVSLTTKGDPFFDAASSLGGVTSTAVWDGLSNDDNTGFPSFPGALSWPSSIAPNSVGGVTTTAGLNKAGNAYPASDSIYIGGTSGTANTYGATISLVSTPLADVSSVVLQVQIGSAFGYDFWNGTLPILLVNGDELTPLESEVTHQAQNGFYLGLPVYVNTYGLQWDLSGLADPVTELEVVFDAVQHSQLYGLRLDQSDAVVQTSVLPVPEPSGVVLCAFAFSGFLVRRSRNR